MYLNGFSVRVPEGRESGGYVELEHGEHYTLRLRNNNHPRCDAKVEIDNQHIGTFRLNGGQSIRLERPAHDKGRFTFYLAGSEEAEKIGLDEDDPHLGLIKVTFMPEKERIANTDNTIWYESGVNLRTATVSYSAQAGGQGLSAGGTGLSGRSKQEFSSTAPLDYDRSRTTTIHLRLVGRDDDEPRPLTSFSTPIPPPVR